MEVSLVSAVRRLRVQPPRGKHRGVPSGSGRVDVGVIARSGSLTCLFRVNSGWCRAVSASGRWQCLIGPGTFWPITDHHSYVCVCVCACHQLGTSSQGIEEDRRCP